MAEQEVICIGCPMGCHVRVSVGNQGEVSVLDGNECRKGEKYVIAEVKSPLRVLTATVLIAGQDGLLPVRTSKPVPRSILGDCMQAVARTRVQPPVKIGQVILTDICETGADLVASRTLDGGKTPARRAARNK